MAKNCLLTKLKATVNDDSLDILVTDDYLRMELPVAANNGVSNVVVIYGTDEDPVDIEVLDGTINQVPDGSTKTDSTHALIGGGYLNSATRGFTVNSSDGTVHVIIKNPEKVKGIDGIVSVTGGISAIEKMTGITSLTINDNLRGYSSPAFDLSDIDWSVFTGINSIKASYLNSVSGNVSNLAALPTVIQSIALNNNSGITGNINAFGRLTNLTMLSLTMAKTSGTVESLVQAMRANGKTTNSSGIAIGYNMGDNVTFNGAAITNNTSKTLTWTASTITITDGGSYNVTVNA